MIVFLSVYVAGSDKACLMSSVVGMNVPQTHRHRSPRGAMYMRMSFEDVAKITLLRKINYIQPAYTATRIKLCG